MKIKILVVVTLLFTASSCAALIDKRRSDDLDNEMSDMVGRDISEVITLNGPPHREFALPNGDKIYSWIKSSGASSTVHESTMFTPTYVTTKERVCQKDYTINKSGVIKSYRHEGRC